MPGMLKIFSTITAPPMSSPVLKPMSVMMPKAEFHATCRRTTRVWEIPFILAKTTYSSFSSCSYISRRKMRR